MYVLERCVIFVVKVKFCIVSQFFFFSSRGFDFDLICDTVLFGITIDPALNKGGDLIGAKVFWVTGQDEFVLVFSFNQNNWHSGWINFDIIGKWSKMFT